MEGIIVNGFLYKCKGRHQSKSFLACVRGECEGRGIKDGETFDLTRGHNHEQDFYLANKVAFKRAIIEKCSESRNMPLREIFDEVCQRSPPEVVAQFSYSQMATTMRRALESRRESLTPEV